MLDCGASTSILKDAGNKELPEPIEKVMRGGTYFSTNILSKPVKRVVVKQKDKGTIAVFPNIPVRELERLRLFSDCLSRIEMAEQPPISDRIAVKHQAKLPLKNGLKNTVDLIKSTTICHTASADINYFSRRVSK